MLGHGPVGFAPPGGPYEVTVVVAPDVWEPVTRDQAKAHLRLPLSITDDDAYIDMLITVARQMLEQRINRAIVPQTVTVRAHGFLDGMTLPLVPYLGGLEVTYTTNGETLALDAAEYYLDTSVEPARLYPATGTSYPSVTYAPGAVQFSYMAGYPDVTAVPAPLKHWILLAIGTLYNHRETVAAGVSVTDVAPEFMKMLWQPYMVYA